MKTKEIKGITLVALVITIVVLLILAGVSLNMVLGGNGIITKAKLAKQMSEVSSEKEAIQMDVMLAIMEKRLDESNKYYIGIPLYDRTLENGDKWCILVNNETLEQYGTGYSHILKDTEINNYGKTQYEWLVNYNSGDVIQLNEKYTELSYKSTLAVTDGLLFNMDAANVTGDISSWGKNVTLRYYDAEKYDTIEKRKDAWKETENLNDGGKETGYDREISNDTTNYIDLEKKALKFNGNNYIEIYNENGFDVSDGFTFEFYGNLEGSVRAISEEFPYIGLLGFWDGIPVNNNEVIRFGYMSEFSNTSMSKHLIYNLISWTSSNYGSWGEENWPCNQIYSYDNFLNNDVYLTLVFKPKNDKEYSQQIYIDGKLLAEGWLTKEYYKEFIGNAKRLNYIGVGRAHRSYTENWCYAKGLCYTSRIYNRGLTSEEVEKNVVQTKIYRQAIK